MDRKPIEQTRAGQAAGASAMNLATIAAGYQAAARQAGQRQRAALRPLRPALRFAIDWIQPSNRTK